MLIAQGTEAGGYTGTIATMVLTPEIVDLAGSVPVLAAGGIASGRQMAAALALGAAGVWCGSVWLSSSEDITPDVVKAKYQGTSSNDTLRSLTRTGKPARQLRRAWHDEWEKPGPAADAATADGGQRGLESHRRCGDRRERAGDRSRVLLRRPGRRRLPSAPAGRRDHPALLRDCEQRLAELAALTTTPTTV